MKHATDFEMSKENKIISTVSVIVTLFTWIVYGFNSALALFLAANLAVSIKDYFTGVDMDFRVKAYKSRKYHTKGFITFVGCTFLFIWAVSNIHLAILYLLIPISEHLVALKGIKNEQTI